MNKEKLLMLEKYLEAGFNTIFLENVSDDFLEETVILNSDCDLSLLNGHYEGIDFVAPAWYNELLNKKENPVLVIKDINKISLEEQTKFIEILKYRKVSTFKLPDNCFIIVTGSNLDEKPINEDVYSLIAHI